MEPDEEIPDFNKEFGGIMTKKYIAYSLPESVKRVKKERQAVLDKRNKDRKNRKRNRR
jgi:hypothetical protein